jgi:hypothetical protein
VELVSLYAILTSASVVCQAFSRRKGELENAIPPDEVGAGVINEAEADQHVAQRCTVCGRFSVPMGTPVSCMKCSRRNSYKKAHDKAADGQGRASTCELGRCKESCRGRERDAA